MSVPWRFLSGIALFVLSANAYVSELADSEVWLNFAQDEEGAVDYSLYLSLALGPDDQLLLGAGRNKRELLDVEIDTDSYLLGYSTLRGAPWNQNFIYEYWGKRRELVIQSITMETGYLAADWDASLEFKYRHIDLYTRELAGGQRNFNVQSVGLGFNAGIGGGQPRWTVSGKWYDYNEDIQRFNSTRGLFIFGLHNYDHVASLDSWNAATYLTYQLNAWRAGIGYSYQVSELDGLGSGTAALLFDVDATKTISVAVEYGHSYEELGDGTDYLSLGLGLRF